MIENISYNNFKDNKSPKSSYGYLIDQVSKKYPVNFSVPEYEVPIMQNLDFSMVGDNNKIKIFTGNLIEFLKAPKIIYKNINNHDDRRKMREKITSEYPPEINQILINDKMKLNKFSTFPLFIELIMKEPVLANNPKIVSILKSFPKKTDIERYHDMSFTEKEFMVSEIENSALNFIKLFDQKNKTAKL